MIRGGGQTFQKLSQITTIVFDKTGTLANGYIDVACLRTRGCWPENDWWRLIQLAESQSRHWASDAILKHVGKVSPYSKYNAKSVDASEVIETPGRGVSAVVHGVSVLVGNEKHLRDTCVAHLKVMEYDQSGIGPTELRVFVALNGRYAGYISFADRIREEAWSSVRGSERQWLGNSPCRQIPLNTRNSDRLTLFPSSDDW